MFNRKICGKCGRNLRSAFDFCPYCGNALEKRNADWGMLGKNDFEPGLGNQNPSSGNGFSGFNMIFNSLLRNLEKQMRESNKKGALPEDPRGGINISISTFGNMPSMNMGPAKNEGNGKKQEEMKKFFFNNFNSEKLKKYSKLPKAEPRTMLRRISNKVFYEVELPGVKTAKDVSIVHLENSMELKAVSDKKAYKKTIPMNFPILDYKISDGKLVLEMDARGN